MSNKPMRLRLLRGDTARNDAYIGILGELTLDTEKNELRIHDGIKQGGTPIPLISINWLVDQLFDLGLIDENEEPIKEIIKSTTAPSNPEIGQLWLNTTTFKLYIFHDNGTSTVWVEVG